MQTIIKNTNLYTPVSNHHLKKSATVLTLLPQDKTGESHLVLIITNLVNYPHHSFTRETIGSFCFTKNPASILCGQRVLSQKQPH